MIIIDGSQGEGGGQILRSALTLSIATGKPFTIDKIRANRDKPGLMRQHMTAVKAAAKISGASVDGGEVGSSRLVFEPGDVKPGEYAFNIGSAGSTTLVLQTVLLPLALAGAPSRLTLQGGTHNLGAPPFEFLDRAFMPLLRRMGFDVTVQLIRPGYYPAGGGEIEVEINPYREKATLGVETRGALVSQTAEAIVANLPYHIAEREMAVIGNVLGLPPEALFPRIDERGSGPGNCVLISLVYENITEVFTGFGRHGVRGEKIAQGVAEEARTYLATPAPIGGHLADQLLLPMVLGAGGSFVTADVSSHTHTNISIIQSFLGQDVFALRNEGNGLCLVEAKACRRTGCENT